MKPRVMIATPTPGSVKTGYMKTVIATLRDLGARGIDCDFATAEGTDIVVLRNMLVNRFFEQPALTHIFFIDSDMVFPRDLGARLLDADKPMIGALYVKRALDLEALARGLKAAPDELAQALRSVSPWHHYPLDGSATGAIRKVRAIPFGAALVRREVFAAMIDKGVAPKAAGARDHNFFGAIPAAAAEGRHFAEDQSFCYRWTAACAGEVWALTDVPIVHIGDFAYGGIAFEA